MVAYIRLDLAPADAARFLEAWDNCDGDALDAFGVTGAFVGVQDFINSSSGVWNDRTTLDDGVLSVEIWGEEEIPACQHCGGSTHWGGEVRTKNGTTEWWCEQCFEIDGDVDPDGDAVES